MTSVFSWQNSVSFALFHFALQDQTCLLLQVSLTSYFFTPVPYDYTVEVTNRFKGLNLIGRVPEELCTEVHERHCTGGSDQDHPQEK